MGCLEAILFLTVTTVSCVTSDDIIFVTDLLEAKIWSGTLNPLSLGEIPLQNLTEPTAIEYNPIEEKVYWTDRETRTINRAFINGSDQEIVIQLPVSSIPEGLAIDVDDRQLYWTDNGTDTIGKSDLNGNNVVTLFDLDLQKPRAIVVDSKAGYLYWSDWGTTPKIERGATDGTDRTTFVSSGLHYPNGLAIDYEGAKLFWCDAGLDIVESINLDGSGRSGNIITTPINMDILPFDIAVYNEHLYWTDWTFTKLVQLTIDTGHAQTLDKGFNFRRAGGLHIYQDINECESMPCKNGGLCIDLVNAYVCDCANTGWQGDTCEQDIDECQLLPSKCDSNADCINTMGSFLCRCRDGYSGDGSTCSEITSTPTYSTLQGTSMPSSPTTSEATSTIKSSTDSSTQILTRTARTTCTHPGSIEHGHSAPLHSRHELIQPSKIVAYFCNEDYYLVGKHELRCMADSSWSGEKPYCKPKSDDDENNKGKSQASYEIVGAIIGGVVVILIVTMVVAVICFCVLRNKESRRPSQQPNNAGINLGNIGNNHLYDVPRLPLVTITSPNSNNDHTYDVPREITDNVHNGIQGTSTSNGHLPSIPKDLQGGENTVVATNQEIQMSSIRQVAAIDGATSAVADEVALPLVERNPDSLYMTPCTKPQLIEIPEILTENLDVRGKWRNILHRPDVLQTLKPILTVDYLSHFTDMPPQDKQEIQSKYEYESDEKAAGVFIYKIARLELKSVNDFLQALCTNGQHDIHLYLYGLLTEAASNHYDREIATFSPANTPDMSEREVKERQLHRKIWVDVVTKEMLQLRMLPFNSVRTIFSNSLRHFDGKYGSEFITKKRTKGDMRAVEWLITELTRTESRWPEALAAVLEENNKPLLNKIKREFRTVHGNSDCVCNSNNGSRQLVSEDKPAIENT